VKTLGTCGFLFLLSLSLFGQENYMVPMRDGVRLHTQVWKPQGTGPFPVVFMRAYWPSFSQKFVTAGYVCVGQSTRGHAQSEGVNNRFFDDAKDGYDSLSWIAEQSWCNGDIAMYGKSYWGMTQWLVAPEQHPNLKAIIPQNVNPDLWECGYRCHGALTLGMTATGRAYTNTSRVVAMGWMNFFRSLPLIDLDLVGSGRENNLWNDYVSHSTYDDYWETIGLRDKVDRINIPVYLMSGWYDYYPRATLTYFKKLKDLGANSEIRVVIDPTDHLNRIYSERDFGSGAAKDEVGLAIRWLNHLFRDKNPALEKEPPVKIFVMGINEWRFENEWPLAQTQFTKYYFHSDGAKDGSLGTTIPGNEPPTIYTYDPNDPVPTRGGNHSFLRTDIPNILRAGCVDQRPNMTRQDVLVFSTDPLEEDTEVIGPIEIKLYASSSARDTDFTGILIDVAPDGTAYNLSEGIIRARFRESIWEAPKLLTPGQIYEFTITLQPTANVFKKGHRIRVHVSSSNFPLWDRNPNTGNDQGMDSTFQSAQQTVYHNKTYPSHVLLPITSPLSNPIPSTPEEGNSPTESSTGESIASGGSKSKRCGFLGLEFLIPIWIFFFFRRKRMGGLQAVHTKNYVR